MKMKATEYAFRRDLFQDFVQILQKKTPKTQKKIKIKKKLY